MALDRTKPTVVVEDGGGSVTVDGPLTDVQLRATAVPVSGPLTDGQLRATAVPVSGPLTDAQLRATAVPVSAASLPLPTGAASETTLAAVNTATGAQADVEATGNGSVIAILKRIRTLLGGTIAVSGTFWQATQPVSAASLPLPTGAATETTLATLNTTANFDSKVGALAEVAPTTDTASSGLNGRLQRIAQRLTSLIALLPTALTGNNALRVEQVVAGPTQPVSGTVTANLAAGTNNIGDVDVLTVPAPLSTTGGGLEATALRVTIASDSTGVLSVDDNGGSITVDGPLTDAQLRATAVPVSAATLPLPTGAATEATLAAQKAAFAVAAVQATASGNSQLIATGTRKVKRVEASNTHATAAVTVGLQAASLNGGVVFGKKYLPAAGGQAAWVFPDGFLPITAEVFNVNLSAAGTVEVTAYYE